MFLISNRRATDTDCIATERRRKNMNIATYELPSWTAEVQHFINKTAFYTPIVWKAFNKTLAPVIISSAKGFVGHWFETECFWRQRITGLAGITYNPLTASVSAAYSELTSSKAQATYVRIRHIIREAAKDALVIGLCGVVAIASGIELSQKVYRQAKAAYAWVNAKLNPAGPEPMILPTVGMAIAPHQESALQQEKPLEDVQALIAEDEEYERQFMAKLERLDDVKDCANEIQAQVENDLWDGEVDYEPVEFSPSSEFAPLSDLVLALSPTAYTPVFGPIVNPAPTDMHTEVQRMATAPAKAEDELVSALEVPGATGKRTRTSKSTRNAGTNAKPKTGKGDAEVTANEPKRRRAAK
jgi:hypothetical protein